MRLLTVSLLFVPVLFMASSKAVFEDQGTVVTIGKLTATTPQDWKKEKPANLLRSYQFKLPGEKELAECELAVFPESHPDPEKTFPKWKATFVPPEGKTLDEIAKITKWMVPGVSVTVLDIAEGTWKYRERPNDPKSKEMLLEDYRVIWVIVAGKDEATHIRLSGPAPSVRKQFAAFETWVKSLK